MQTVPRNDTPTRLKKAAALLVAGAVGILSLLSAFTTINPPDEFYFGNESMVGKGGWPYLSVQHYRSAHISASILGTAITLLALYWSLRTKKSPRPGAAILLLMIFAITYTLIPLLPLEWFH